MIDDACRAVLVQLPEFLTPHVEAIWRVQQEPWRPVSEADEHWDRIIEHLNSKAIPIPRLLWVR